MDYFNKLISIIFYNHKQKRCNTLLLILWPHFQDLNQVTLKFISAKDQLTNILKATGQKFEEAEIAKVVDSLKGKKLEDVNYENNSVNQSRIS